MSLIDVLCLHHPKDSEKSAVRALGGSNLNSITETMIADISAQLYLSRKKLAIEVFGVNPNSLVNWCGHNSKYPEGHPVPIWALKRCLRLHEERRENFHLEIARAIRELQCGRVARTVKAVVELTPELVQLAGAHAADGSLYLQPNRGPITCLWEIGDQEESNMRAAQKWIANLFGIQLEVTKKGNMYYMRSNIQVIPRYLIRVLDFPTGEKSHTVKEPKVISERRDKRVLVCTDDESRWALRLLFAKEVVNFDGHSTITGGLPSIGLGSQSDRLREALSDVFRHFGVEFKNYNSHKKMLTTSWEQSRRLYDLGLFRGGKRAKLKNLLYH